MRFAREQVSDPSLNTVRQRVRWWSAIALLRSIASSPAAAEQTLLNRSELSASETKEDADSIAAPPASSMWTSTTPSKATTPPSAPIPSTVTDRTGRPAVDCANSPPSQSH